MDTPLPHRPLPIDGGGACLLVVGAPGAGKSTVTRLVGAALSRAALLEDDVISRLVVSGRVWALGEPADEAHRQTRQTNDNIVWLAASFADAGSRPSSTGSCRTLPGSTSMSTCSVTAVHAVCDAAG